MEASCTVQTQRNSCKFFSENDNKKTARAITKNQVSDPGPSWPSCLKVGFFKKEARRGQHHYFQIVYSLKF